MRKFVPWLAVCALVCAPVLAQAQLLLGVGTPRSSSSGAWTPANLTTPADVWLDAGDNGAGGSVVNSGTTLTSIANKGALTATLTPGGTVAYIVSGLNGRGVINATSGNVISAANVTVPSGNTVTIVGVWQPNTTRGGSDWLFSIASNVLSAQTDAFFLPSTNGGPGGSSWLAGDIVGEGGATGLASTPFVSGNGSTLTSDGAFHVFRVTFGTTNEAAIDGTVVTRTSSFTGSFAGVTEKVRLNNGGGAGNATATKHAEVVEARNASTSDNQKIEGYMACHWGLTLSGGPYAGGTHCSGGVFTP